MMEKLHEIYDNQTIMEQEAYEHYKKTEAENYHLKKQLANKNKDIKRLKHEVRVWKGKHDKLTQNRKPRYNNNGNRR